MAVSLFVPLRTRSLWVNIIIACLPINLLLRFKPHSGVIYYEYVDGQNCCLNGVVYLNVRKGEINDVLWEHNRPSVQTPSWLSLLLELETCVPTKWKANINWDVSAKKNSPSHFSSVCGTDSWMYMLLKGLVSVRLFICIFGNRESITFNPQGCKGGMYHGFQLNNNNTLCPLRTESTY